MDDAGFKKAKAAIDKNKDGKITKQEVYNYIMDY